MYMRHTMHATVYCKQEQVYSFTVVCRYFVTLSQIPQGWYPYSKAKLTLHLSHSQANFGTGLGMRLTLHAISQHTGS